MTTRSGRWRGSCHHPGYGSYGLRSPLPEAPTQRRHHSRRDDPRELPLSPRLSGPSASQEHAPLLRRPCRPGQGPRTHRPRRSAQRAPTPRRLLGSPDAPLLWHGRVGLSALQGTPALRRRHPRPQGGPSPPPEPPPLDGPHPHQSRTSSTRTSRGPRLPLTAAPTARAATYTCVQLRPDVHRDPASSSPLASEHLRTRAPGPWHPPTWYRLPGMFQNHTPRASPSTRSCGLHAQSSGRPRGRAGQTCSVRAARRGGTRRAERGGRGPSSVAETREWGHRSPHGAPQWTAFPAFLRRLVIWTTGHLGPSRRRGRTTPRPSDSPGPSTAPHPHSTLSHPAHPYHQLLPEL
jgi:hypothetical protein